MRERAKAQKRKGHITGSGRRHEPTPESRERYRDAVRLYRDTAMTIKEIAEKLGLNQFSFTNYLQTWHREDVFARPGVAEVPGGGEPLAAEQYKKPTAANTLRPWTTTCGEPSGVGDRRGVWAASGTLGGTPQRARAGALRPTGMMRAPNGRASRRHSMKKNTERAMGLYETTAEPLKSIARRLGLNYNSLGGFVRRRFSGN